MSRKNVGHHGLATERILGFEWPSSNDFATFVVFFFGILLKFMFSVFLVSPNNFSEPFYFYKSFFHKSPWN